MTPDTDKYRLLIKNLPDAFAYHKVLTDKDGKPVDYIFLEVNSAFEEMTGLKKEMITGKKVTEVLPGIEKSEFDWIGTYGRVALNGEPIRFESFSEPLSRWYDVSAYSDKPGYFA
ncbi:MAG: PAS domain S-box protein, partial [Bacillota bacterium]